jgi:hypothetical protein
VVADPRTHSPPRAIFPRGPRGGVRRQGTYELAGAACRGLRDMRTLSCTTRLAGKKKIGLF